MANDRSIRTSRSSGFDRRKALAMALGAAGAAAGSSPLPAQGQRVAVARVAPAPEPPPRVPPARTNPVLFWSDTALQLDALDHSVDAKDARAPGPCAASRALALAHIVMADACVAAYDSGFEGFYLRRGRAPANEFSDVFVGGAAARILGHIYTTPAHTHLIGFQRQHFLKHYDSRGLEAWNAGLEFGRNERFTSQWHWETIKNAATSSTSRGVALRRGEHDVDPFNPDQKFYGVTWSRIPPLLPSLPIRSYGPGDPPPEQDRDYIRDLEEVREFGAFRPDGPTADQVKIGVYWAYDGARLLGTPPRLYNQIVTQIAETDGFSTPELARLLALCNIAMADAGIVCWEAKYRYQLWRPVRGIPNALSHPDPGWRPFGAPRTNPMQFALGSDAQRLTALSMLGGGERTWSGEPVKDALPYSRACFTPNFPSYPSGHATFGSACSISPAGQVSATLPGQTQPSNLGQLALTRFINKAGLQAIGDNLFVETPASGQPQDGVPNTDGMGDLQQGNLEQANVEAVTEISDLIAAQRAYEMNGKVISAADQMLSATSNLMR